uniref:Uncharacterized protein n=1 Tax=Hemiselmis tepida TaxID=464990 RepID=A0A7S0WCF0_9CRYP|mmetsp:Transcript_5239/g.13336  ORF Transcript_5239/g.13336 Transcript_5239/m.13336 type:complete len:253 (+) Transcript_5239:24-782(+)
MQRFLHLATALVIAGCVVLATFQVVGNARQPVALEQLAKVPSTEARGPQTVPVITGNGFGTNSAFIGMGDGSGTSVKARTTQLMMPDRFKPGFVVHKQLPDAGTMGTDTAYLGKFDGAGQSTKAARTTSLDQEYEQYGQKARAFYKKAGLMSKNEARWASSMATGGEKAPVQMLAQLRCGQGGPCPQLAKELKSSGITSEAERKWVAKMPVEGFKAPFEELKEVSRTRGGAARTVGRDVAGYLFGGKHGVGL